MPRGVAGPGKKSGRPRVLAEQVTRALEMVDAGTHSAVDAAREVGVSHMAVYRARWERGEGVGGETPAGGEVAPVDTGEASAGPELGEALVAPDVIEDALSPPDPARAAALRLLVVRGTMPGVDEKGEAVELPVDFGADWIARVAEGEGVSAGEVRRWLRRAAVDARLDTLPWELAAERSISVGEKFLQMALEAHDGRAGLAAQAHIDRIRLAPPPPDPEGLTRAQVTILLGRIAGELQALEGGVEALRRALGA